MAVSVRGSIQVTTCESASTQKTKVERATATRRPSQCWYTFFHPVERIPGGNRRARGRLKVRITQSRWFIILLSVERGQPIFHSATHIQTSRRCVRLESCPCARCGILQPAVFRRSRNKKNTLMENFRKHSTMRQGQSRPLVGSFFSNWVWSGRHMSQSRCLTNSANPVGHMLPGTSACWEQKTDLRA